MYWIFDKVTENQLRNIKAILLLQIFFVHIYTEICN